MKLVPSNHWKRKRKYRKDISDDLIEHAIQNSNEMRDKYWEDASNAVCRFRPWEGYSRSCTNERAKTGSRS